MNRNRSCKEAMWDNYFNLQDIDFVHSYINCVITIKDYKIAEFSFKVYNKILATSETLSNWKILKEKNCLICNVKGDLLHTLFGCLYIKSLWNSLNDSNFIDA
jgi:hypothetical protein